MSSFREQFPSWGRWAPELAAGLINGIIAITLELSFAVLIFSGPLANRVAMGIGLTLFGTLVISLLVGLFSSFKGVIAVPQDSPAAILALMAVSIADALQGVQSEERILITVVAAIAVTSLISGVFFWLLGPFPQAGFWPPLHPEEIW